MRSVSTGTGGIFTDLTFFAGFILGIVVTSVVMLRDQV